MVKALWEFHIQNAAFLLSSTGGVFLEAEIFAASLSHEGMQPPANVMHSGTTYSSERREVVPSVLVPLLVACVVPLLILPVPLPSEMICPHCFS